MLRDGANGQLSAPEGGGRLAESDKLPVTLLSGLEKKNNAMHLAFSARPEAAGQDNPPKRGNEFSYHFCILILRLFGGF